MKFKFLLPAMLMSALMLTGCNNADTPSENGGESGSENQTSEQSEQSGENNSSAEFEEFDGESNEFPMDKVNEFLALFEMNVTLPAPEATGTWMYEQTIYNGYADFYAMIEDKGTPGTNAIEDTYKAQLEAAGFTVEDENYDDVGYEVYVDEYEDFYLVFYTYDDAFSFDLMGPFMPTITTGFPVQETLAFLADCGLELTANDIVVPDGDKEWASFVSTSYFGDSYYAFTEGEQADLDAYLAKAETAGWEVEDYSDAFECPSYYVYKEFNGVEVDFFTCLDEGLLSIDVSIYE